MKKLRRIVLWAVLLGIGLLIFLSVTGTLLQTEEQSAAQRAKVMFNSPPLVAYWIVLTGLLVIGLVCFQRLRRSFGLLTVHLGSILVLLGAMCGSDGGHRLAAKYFGQKKIPFGYMIVPEGHQSNDVYQNGKFREKDKIAELPFSILLKDFRIDYYDRDQPWVLLVEGKQAAADGKERYVQKSIDWAENRDRAIPFTDATLRVLKHFASARPTYGQDSVPALEITNPDGEEVSIPAEVGQIYHVDEPHTQIRILQVFSNLKVQISDGKSTVVDVPGPADNPAVRIEIYQPGKEKEKVYQYVGPNGAMHGGEDSPFKCRFIFTEPSGAVPDPDTQSPAVKVLLKYKQKEMIRWLIVPKGKAFVPLSLAELLTDDPHQHDRMSEAGPVMYLAIPRPQIRDYISDLAVFEEEQIVKEKSIEVNHPLHYGGYHFYQHSYDERAQQYTILSVASDSGLLAVYIGFALTGFGVFWLFWGKPAWLHLTRRRNNGD